MMRVLDELLGVIVLGSMALLWAWMLFNGL